MGFVSHEVKEEEGQPGINSAMQKIVSVIVYAEDYAGLCTLLMRTYGIDTIIMKKEPWVIDAIAHAAIKLEN